VTLRLVSDNAEPRSPDYANIPEMLRQYAAEIEAGAYGDPICAVLIIERADQLAILGCGEEPTAYEMMGLFEAAKLKAFADDFVDD
jgi:hypothetical protein